MHTYSIDIAANDPALVLFTGFFKNKKNSFAGEGLEGF